MMNYEGYDQGEARALVSPCAGAPCRGLYEDLEAYPLTSDQAIAAIRARLCPIDCRWCGTGPSDQCGTGTSNQQVIDRVCGQADLFTGTGCGDDFDIRCGLGCPTSAQVSICGSCAGATRYACVNGTCRSDASGPYASQSECVAAGCKAAPAAGDMTPILIGGGLLVVAALAFYIASQGKKKIVIARVEK